MNELIFEKLKQKLLEFKDVDYGYKQDKNNPQNITNQTYLNSLKLLNYLIYEPEVFLTYNRSVQFEFQLNNSYLEVEVFDNHYSIWGDNTYIQYNDNGINIKLDDLFEVINHIKIFYNGLPKKSVLFTGAFNPPTIAHYHMIESSINNGFDYVIFATSNQKFLDRKQKKIKNNSGFAYSEKERIEMLLAMTFENPKVLIFGVEQGYTYEVLCAVKNKYNITNLYFAMGSDKLNEIDRWGFHNQLLKEFCFYVLIRGSDNENIVKQKCNHLFENTNYIIGKDNEEYKNISATQVRFKIVNNEDISYLVHPKVKKILQNKKHPLRN